MSRFCARPTHLYTDRPFQVREALHAVLARGCLGDGEGWKVKCSVYLLALCGSLPFCICFPSVRIFWMGVRRVASQVIFTGHSLGNSPRCKGAAGCRPPLPPFWAPVWLLRRRLGHLGFPRRVTHHPPQPQPFRPLDSAATYRAKEQIQNDPPELRWITC